MVVGDDVAAAAYHHTCPVAAVVADLHNQKGLPVAAENVDPDWHFVAENWNSLLPSKASLLPPSVVWVHFGCSVSK